jgi:hypothetical protein
MHRVLVCRSTLQGGWYTPIRHLANQGNKLLAPPLCTIQLYVAIRESSCDAVDEQVAVKVP